MVTAFGKRPVTVWGCLQAACEMHWPCDDDECDKADVMASGDENTWLNAACKQYRGRYRGVVRELGMRH